ncbi:MAG: amylo-alpha-1,6-glucosidase [Thermodesulfobacteriota bacterium]
MIRFDHNVCRDLRQALRREWLETNGLGGFASSTIAGLNTRRYHGLLTVALRPPADRFLLLSKLEETLVVGGRRFELSANQYPGVVHPQGYAYLKEFRLDPFPVLVYAAGGIELEKSVALVHGESTVVVTYAVRRAAGAAVVQAPALEVRPLVAFRDFHALTHENAALDRRVALADGIASITPYAGLPELRFAHDAASVDASGFWYRDFEYAVERERGLDFREDLYQPFTLHFDFATRERASIVAGLEQHAALDAGDLLDREVERRRAIAGAVPAGDELQRTLALAADQYLVARSPGKSVIAGYPWFGDWGRDTFIGVRGLCLATGRFDDAREILTAWTAVVSDGMLPNRFADHGEALEYNSVDAALWFVVAAHELLATTAAAGHRVPPADADAIWRAVEAIVAGYAAGTRYHIGVDEDDGLLFAGEPGIQLTWMDAKVGDWVVTPRIGKPVEVQALWLSALHVAGQRSERWRQLFLRGRASFVERFWNEHDGCLYDVVDPDGHRGAVDASFRPNQVFAVGGLPVVLLDDERARRVVDALESRLWTPLGLRTLAPDEPGYVPRYEGGVRQRDGAYHQGTVWPWLLGPFVEAWVRVRGSTPEARHAARKKFLTPLESHLRDAGLGHVSEIVDGEAPWEPRGCPFQAWSVGEALRLVRSVLA